MAWKALKTALAIIPGLFVFLIISGVARGTGANPNLGLFVGSAMAFGVFFFIVRNIER